MGRSVSLQSSLWSRPSSSRPTGVALATEGQKLQKLPFLSPFATATAQSGFSASRTVTGGCSLPFASPARRMRGQPRVFEGRGESFRSSARQPRKLQWKNFKKNIMVQLGRPLLRKYHNLRVVIRMALGGCTNRPHYRIVAAHNKRARDGKYLEQIGCYDPLPNDHDEKIVGLNFDRIKYWLGNGASITKPVEKLLGLSGFFPLHPMTVTNAERIKRRKKQEAAKAVPVEVSADKE